MTRLAMENGIGSIARVPFSVPVMFPKYCAAMGFGSEEVLHDVGPSAAANAVLSSARSEVGRSRILQILI